MIQHSKINKDEFIELNRLSINHSRNQIVNFQSLLNLSIYERENLEKLERILIKQKYPTLFYRLASQIDLLPSSVSDKTIALLKKYLIIKDFNKKVKAEIKSTIQ